VLISVTNDARSGKPATLEDIEAKIDELQAEAKELVESVDGNEDDLSAENMDRLEEIYAEVDELARKAKIKRRLAEDADGRRSAGRRTVPDRRPAAPRRAESVPAQARNPEDMRTHGFASFGDFAADVGAAYRYKRESALEHLTNAATTYGSESVGGDGGWLVPPEFSAQIWQKVNGEGSLLELCAPFTTSRNSLSFPKDETTPWDNSAGITVYWEGEGGTGTEAKPKFEIGTARLNKLMALVKVTEELLEDASGLDSYLRYWTPIKMQARLNTAVVRGNGVGKPLGIINHGSIITVSKETSQDAATIIFPNINKMWSRLYAPCRRNAVWLINQDCEPMLNGMAFIPAATQPGGSTTMLTSYVPIYMPSGTIQGSPYGSLMGRPVMPMQPCSTLGTIGDIILTDLSQYMALRKAQAAGIRVDTSIHLHFDQAVDSYRFIFRVTGQPMWNSTIAPENGNNTLSWAVVLETRS
jgi:HK97 family phage major capsid protein